MRQDIIEGFRFSPQQERLWMLQQADQSPAYCVQGAVLIKGNLQAEILQAALQRVVNRHEILRTHFRCLPGMGIPVQVITDSDVQLEQKYNPSSWGPQEQEAPIEVLFHEAVQSLFNLEQGPVLRASLITLSQHEHVLFVSLPALCADTVTLQNLVREISRSYAACLHNEELSGEPLQYADFSEWQNELLESEDTEKERAYWREQNIAALLSLKLPSEHQASGGAVFEPQLLSLTVDPNLATKIEALVRKYGTSIFVFLVACWQVLLWHLTGQPDILVGASFDCRPFEELEEALGLFAKYLPLHAHLEEKIPFKKILEQVHVAASEMRQQQQYFSWKQTVGSSGAGKMPSFFPFCFDFEELAARYTAENVSFSLYKQYACVDRFKVKLSCVRREDALMTEFHYDPDLFLVEDIRRLAGQFHTLLESVLKAPEGMISELEILSDAERKQVLIDFNNTKGDYPEDKCLHHLFEEQVKRTPDNLAVVFKGQQLTYAELDARANQLAHYLQKLGVGPEVLVGVCVERSVEMVVGLLGILKAGGAYVPLDLVYPKDRLAFMLQDSQVPVLLTQQRLVEKLPAYEGRVIYLDTDWEAITWESKEIPLSSVGAQNVAYLIYTSGSTGKPKGVIVAHRNVVHSTAARLTYYREPVVGFLLLSSFAFDSSVAVLFWTLCQGGKLLLPEESFQYDLLQLGELIAQNNISHLLSIPSLYAHLLERVEPRQLASLHTVIVAGESCPGDLVARHSALLPQAVLFNEYGPTEGTVWSTVYKVQPKSLSRQVPIGRPIANTQVYVLDSRLQPVPIGVVGELYIGGAGVARGYLDRPELTAERFIPNPFSDRSGDRLYKTGDLVRYQPDGNIEFLGRIDHQVKVRGYRIELGEIETVLSQHPAVHETVVVAREDEPGDKRLIAYVVPHQKQACSVSDLRAFLKEELPDYMVPSAFVLLPSLPLTPNGKVDRQALPVPDATRSVMDRTFVAPRTHVEEILAEIWGQVLGIEQIGIHDNFFELGGDSILSIQIIARANQIGLHLTPKQLFQHQTIAELATVAGAIDTIQAEQRPVMGPLPLTPIQHWFFEQRLPEPHHWNQGLLLEAQHPLDPALLEKAVEALLTHHDALRLRFIQAGATWQQINAGPDDTVPFTRIDLSALPRAEQGTAMEAAVAELQASLHLSEGPLLRVARFVFGEHKADRLLIVIHHLAVDGVSWQILLEDLQTAYQQLSRGEAVKLPPKTTSFKEWSQRLTQYAQSESLRQELDYWLVKPRTLTYHLPVDYSQGEAANTEALARSVSMSLGVEETRALLQEIPAAYHAQINDVLLAALVQTFARWTGMRSLLLNLEGHGREDLFSGVDLSRTVGWFTTTFPVLLELRETDSPEDVLKTIKEQLRRIPNRGIGYGVLRYLTEDAEIAKKLRALPEAEVAFNYLGQFDQMLPGSSLLRLTEESSGPDRSPHGTRGQLLEIVGSVVGGRLQLTWTYSEGVHRRSTIENLARGFVEALQLLIDHCQSSKGGGYTPSDFAAARLSQEELDELVAGLSQPEE